MNILLYGIGLKFLFKNNKNYNEFNLTSFLNTGNHIPVVIFPECTKTNRVGVLSIRSNLMDNFYNLANENRRLLIRSEIAVKNFVYFSPDNTTDVLGLKTLFYTCSQFFNKIEIIAQDIPNNNFDRSITNDILKFNKMEEYLDQNLQSSLVEPNCRNIVSLTSKDHITFLKYFHQTSKDASYVKKEF